MTLRRAFFAWTHAARIAAAFFALLMVMALPAHGAGGIQGNLTGTVLDASTGKPLADVQILARSPSGRFAGSTDAGGHFTLLGLPADTYTVSFSKNGYDSVSLPGVAVFGDETDSVGDIRLNKSLKTITHVSARARNGAFQPTQTQDVTTISGQRITQALGSATNQNEQQLILAAPGAILDAQNNVTIRGSLNVELGYQYDGVNFTVPFFDGNGSSDYLSNITGGSGGSLQLVSGSGDATQGNIGAGVINIVPPRGTFPADGLVSAQVEEPFYNHQFSVNYGWATPNNRISDFFSYDGSRSVPEYAPFGVDAASIGAYYGTSLLKHDDIVNNFVYRFGHQNAMALQWLFRDEWNNQWGNYGGLQAAHYYPYNPLAYTPWDQVFPNGVTQLNSVTRLMAGVPSSDVLPAQPEMTLYQPLNFNKIGFTWNLNASTFMSLAYADFFQESGGTDYYQGVNGPSLTEVGGQRLFGEFDLTHQFGSAHTTTLAIRYQDDLPRWFSTAPYGLLCPLSGYCSGGTTGSPYAPDISDWYLPANPSGIGKPISAANPCQTNAVTGNPGSCYVYDWLVTNGKWTGSLPLIPTDGIDYHHAIFHEAGIGIRDQWSVNSRLHLDYGLRIDADNMDWGKNPWGGPTLADALGNPSDIIPNQFGDAFNRPRIWQPRFAASYQLGANDALRFSYGRSVEFFFAQTAGTPLDMTNVDPILSMIPPKDSAAGANLLGLPLSGLTPTCGSGTNPTHPQPGGGTGLYWFCSNYAQQLFWMDDQCCDAPDLGGYGPPTYNNWDLAWSHQFTRGTFNGFGMKLTGFARRGYNVEENTLLSNGVPDPVTGQTSASVFATRANGVEKTSGLEFMLTAPDRAVGLSGFLTLNYISEFSSTPPVGGGTNLNLPNDQLPILYQYEFDSGQLYRSAFLPPFQGRLGLSYQTASGWRINPIFAFDGGFPTGVGAFTYNAVNGAYVWIPETNFGAANPLGGPNGPQNPYNASYFVDPANPGSYLRPNVAASRGWGEPALPGGTLTKAHGSLDFALEYTPHGSDWTLGTYVSNVFNNHYGLWFANTVYQPVSTGVSGPQTGTYQGAYPGNPLWVAGARDPYPATLPYGPFSVGYNAGTTIQFYVQRRI